MKRTLWILAASAVAACGGSSPPAFKPAKPLPIAPAEPAAAKFTFPGAPDTPAGEQLAWVLDLLVHRHGKTDRAELEAHFAPSFLQQVPSDKLVGIFTQLADQVPGLAINTVEGADDRLIAHTLVGQTKLAVSLQLDASKHQIAALSLNPENDVGAKPESYEDALHLASALAPRAQLLVAYLDQGACRPLQELAADDELAIGSSFNLYTLLALADQLIAGKARWTDDLAVRDDWKSLPSGTTQNELPGTKLKLQAVAERMIAISDNTAADHLLYTLGRKQVEAALRETKHARPGLDTPFLATRELFVLKLGAPDELERYLKLPEARRRDYLDKTLAGKTPHVDKLADWKGARRIDKLEWFASANDLCRVMGALWTRAQNAKAHAVLDVLAKNPGLPIDHKVWPYIGFKGGSEPGVLNMTYLLRRNDDRWFVITLGFNAAEGDTLDDTKIYNLATGLIELVGQTR